MKNAFDSNVKLKGAGLATQVLLKGIGMAIEKELPPARYKKVATKDLWIPMPDGARLAATVCTPEGVGGPLPVILLGNPYAVGEDMYRNMMMPLFARQGYAGIYVRNRGTLYSEGEWVPFENERRDGRAVIDWICDQPWCDGNIGTYGSSYCGFIQWGISDYDHPALKTMFISVSGAKPYDVFYRRGMFRQDIWTHWAASMMGKYRYQSDFSNDFRQKAYAVKPQVNLGEEMIGEDCTWYRNWVTNTLETDPYWASGFWKEFADCIDKIRIPLFLHTGWYDVFLRTELETFRELPEEVRKQSRLVIGPWGHSGLAAQNALKFPGENNLGLLQLRAALAWFDHFLKGMPYREEEKQGTVETYSIGDNQWVTWDGDIAPSGSRTYYFQFGAHKAGELEETNPKEEDSVTYTYDPKHPVHSCGGTILNSVERGVGAEKACLVQPEIGETPGVISFVTDPLERDLHTAGAAEAWLYVKSTAPATAFTIKISELYANGRSINVRDDITDIRWRDEHEVMKYTPGEAVELHLKMTDFAWMFKKGSRIRVDISSSNYPSYHVHPNTEAIWSETTESVVATQTILCGGEYPTRIEIPVV